MKLQKKYFLTFFSLIVILSIGLSYGAYSISKSIVINKYRDSSQENLNYLMDITDKEIDQLTTFFDFISNYAPLVERMTKDYGDNDHMKMREDMAITELLVSLAVDDVFNAIEVLYIEGNNGARYWYSTGDDYLDYDKIRADFERVKYDKGNLVYIGVGESYNTRNHDQTMMRYTRLIFDDNGKQVAKIYSEVKTSYFERIYDGERVVSDTKIQLTDKDGYVLFDRDKDIVGKLSSNHYTEGLVVNGQLDFYDWKLVSATPESYILEDMSVIIRMILLMALLNIAIASALITIITRRFVKPIRDLINAVEEVIEGDYNVYVSHVSDDEIGELSDKFNVMTSRIQSNIEKELSLTRAIGDAEYKALQAQINPHFMYNSLNTLKWIASLQKADSIIKIVDALWILLKKTSSLKGQMTTLGNEIEVIDAYSTIQQARYNGKFQLVYEMKSEHMACRLPKYILQPIVENAVFHGIEPKEGQGIIIIRTDIKDDELIIRVIDDGIGVSPRRIETILANEREQVHESGLNNIGVSNVNERLMMLYGKAYGLSFESEVGFGTTVTMKIPWKNPKEEDQNV